MPAAGCRLGIVQGSATVALSAHDVKMQDLGLTTRVPLLISQHISSLVK